MPSLQKAPKRLSCTNMALHLSSTKNKGHLFNTMRLLVITLSFWTLGSISNANAQGTNNVPKPIFRDGEAQIVSAFTDEKEWIKEELWVETPFDSDKDGRPDRMHVFVTRPQQTESGQLQLPVVYTSSPYYGMSLWTIVRDKTSKYNWNVEHELGETPPKRKTSKLKTRKKRPFAAYYFDRTWVPRGYITVYSSSPGTGLSDGIVSVGGHTESQAPKCVIDWLCGRAKGFSSRKGGQEVKAFWSNGKVGMTGTSYDGTLCLAAATTGVEGLEAIIPIAPVTNFYQYYRSGGLVRSPGGYPGEDADVLFDLVSSKKRPRQVKKRIKARMETLADKQDRSSGDYNAFWASRNYLERLDSVKTPMIIAHAFNDWNVMTEHSFQLYKAVKEKGLPVQLYYHQGGHGGDPSLTMMNRWFTKYLHGVDNGVENDPSVQITREHEYHPTVYSTYPDADAANVTLYPTGENGLGFNASNNSLAQQFTDNGEVPFVDLVKNKDSQHRLLYASPELREDVRISGVANMRIRLKCNQPAANISVCLVALPWLEGEGRAIYDNIITRGWIDPQNRNSISKSEPLQPNEFYEMTFDLMPDDQVIPVGTKIGLVIYASDKEYTLCPDPGTEITVDLQATQLTLPVVGGKDALKKALGE